MVYGYARVSTKEQNEDRQLIAFKESGIEIDRVFVDKQSGKDFERKQYKKAFRRLKENDLLIIKSIDRLGRNYDEIIEQWRRVTGGSVYLLTPTAEQDKLHTCSFIGQNPEILAEEEELRSSSWFRQRRKQMNGDSDDDMPLLDTRREKNLLGSFISDIVLQVLSFVAENERINIRQRQAEGIAAAKARGVEFGRPRKPLPDNFEEACRLWEKREIKLRAAAFMCHMPPTTFHDKFAKWKTAADS